MPSAIAFGLIDPEAFKGDYTRDSTNFKNHGLETFDLQVDARSLVGYPISRQNNLTVPYYYKFLKECNFFGNNYSSSPITFEAFNRFNFMIVENLRRRNVLSGQLTVNLKFSEILTKKLYLVIMPIYKKILTFDEFYTPEVSDNNNIQDSSYTSSEPM